jgi:hypothetical protein
MDTARIDELKELHPDMRPMLEELRAARVALRAAIDYRDKVLRHESDDIIQRGRVRALFFDTLDHYEKSRC